jgi:type I restriction enzyme S subunit
LIKPHGIDARFLYEQLQAGSFRRQIGKLSGGSTFARVNLGDIRSLSILVPPLPEQTKIAEILSTWDAAIETTEKLLANAEKHKRALMQQLLTGKRRLKRFSESWDVKSLADVCRIRKGEQRNRTGLESSGAYPVINGGIEPSGYTDEWNREGDTITISEGGNSCGFVGYVSQRFWSGGHCYALEDLKVSRSFLYFWLKHQERSIMRLRVGSGLPNIQKSDLGEFGVSVPPPEEQAEIANALQAVQDLTALIAVRLKNLRTEKRALMQQLLTGKRRVKV